uniref:60S ribosome subunit biogenesis protein NIP7 pre-PUA domain-containing protein n=1 Tax=Marmota marmota marmota TaxID=9994 RepID=A0A8C5ZCN7_MARMA
MRPLIEVETHVTFEKIAKYIQENLQLLVLRPDRTYSFRLHNSQVYYISEKILKLATSISGDKLVVSLGPAFKNSLRPTMVVYSMAEIPLGFAVASKSTQDCRKENPIVIAVFLQADIGEYVQHEETLT